MQTKKFNGGLKVFSTTVHFSFKTMFPLLLGQLRVQLLKTSKYTVCKIRLILEKLWFLFCWWELGKFWMTSFDFEFDWRVFSSVYYIAEILYFSLSNLHFAALIVQLARFIRSKISCKCSSQIWENIPISSKKGVA